MIYKESFVISFANPEAPDGLAFYIIISRYVVNRKDYARQNKSFILTWWPMRQDVPAPHDSRSEAKVQATDQFEATD